MYAPRALHLASRSLRRRELLKQIGIGFELLLLREAPGRPPDVDECVKSGEDPVAYVERLAREKAEVAWLRLCQRRLMRHPVLTADTTVELDGAIIGKPVDRADAVSMLGRLSGTTHRVHTAIAVILDRRIESALSSTTVVFGELSEDEIQQYVASGEPMDKAGAYAIQGRAGAYVKSLSGSYTGVVGLPLYETDQLLRRFA
ncbi:MAG: septum formation inhibitor Maf [Burkholderiales bacterium]|nr:septum formation inhibitor Maf [Burkholderiales bacterium]